jgi:hypothetical protein
LGDGHASLQDARGGALVQLAVNESEGLGHPGDAPGLGLVRGECRCLNLSTSMGGTRSKVEGEDRHDLELEGLRKDTRHEIYIGSGSQSSYPTSCLE